jgi:hypothetical protein
MVVRAQLSVEGVVKDEIPSDDPLLYLQAVLHDQTASS